MIQSTLTLVFDESAGDPLVLECYWSGDVKRASPDLIDVGNAKPSLRALCMLLILAKYRNLQERHRFIFGDEKEDQKGTWIGTFVNDLKEMEKWIKTCLQLREGEVFFKGKYGAMHNQGGKEPKSVTFDPAIFPVSKLELFIRARNGIGTKKRLLCGEELLALGIEIESKSWTENKSTIAEWHPKEFQAYKLKKEDLGKNVRKIDSSSLSVLPRRISNISNKTSTTVYWKNYFQNLMENEHRVYQEKCTPFFIYLENSSNTRRFPFTRIENKWNSKQLATLAMNCVCYLDAIHLFLALTTFFSHISDDIEQDLMASSSFIAPRGVSWCDVFRHFQKGTNMQFDHLAEFSGEDRDSPLVLEEFRAFDQLLSEEYKGEEELWFGSAEQSRHFGREFVQSILFIDFFDKVLRPLVPLFNTEKDPFGEAIGARLDKFICDSKPWLSVTQDYGYNTLSKPSDLVEATNAGKILLAAQTQFWQALHRRLIVLEG